MRISSINSQNNKTNPSFMQWKREVFSIGGLKHRNDTGFFRGGYFWKNLTNYLDDFYKSTPKVNVFSYGCSDGSEPFTFVMSAIGILKDRANKFFPIKARDYDFKAIDKAFSNNFTMVESEKIYINAVTDNQFKRFFYDPYGTPRKNVPTPVFVRSELYDNVDFEVKDLLKDFTEINPDNSVVLARNFWPYVRTDKERQDFLNKLYNHLGKNSMLIIGEFDMRGTNNSIEKQLLNAGFQKGEIPYVYIKNQ